MENIHRFTSRAGAYAAHRPTYPDGLRTWLATWGPGKAVDLGCGTGIFTRVLGDAGWEVTGVEPNSTMAAHSQGSYSIVSGTAEVTGLPDGCADLVTAAQAFHWFDPVASRKEMERLLRPGGKILLVWNVRDTDTPWGKAYEELLRRHWPEGEPVSHHREWDQSRLEKWFRPRKMEYLAFDNPQQLDWETLRGRLASTSYAPEEESPQWAIIEEELQKLFFRHQKDGTVVQETKSKVYWG